VEPDARPARTAGTPSAVDADLVDTYETALMLKVDVTRVSVMIDQNLLTVAAEIAGSPRFRRAEVEAVRLAGA
jgi:hypothetical protein